MKSYVYCVTNLVNGKQYVGKTIDPVRRWREHRLLAPVGGGRLLKQAIKKHGIDNFKFEVVHELETENASYEVERRLIVERQTLAPCGYNLSEGGVGCFRPSDDVREQMSASQRRRFAKPEEHEKLSRVRRGVKKSEETKARMRQPKSPEHREKLRLALNRARVARKLKLDAKRCTRESEAVKL